MKFGRSSYVSVETVPPAMCASAGAQLTFATTNDHELLMGRNSTEKAIKHETISGSDKSMEFHFFSSVCISAGTVAPSTHDVTQREREAHT